jgi:outer membrane protein assembly factor BamB
MDGKFLWKIDFGKKLPYEWRFDYYYSSPVISKNTILVGSDDGFMYALDKANGKQIWKYDAGSIIRATPTVDGDVVYFGDCSGIVHALNITNGKEIWKCETKGVQIPVGESPFDRKAIFAAVAIQEKVCIVGSRDGFFYGINKADGKIMWSNDYSMSWVLSSAAIKDSMAIAGTSDGRFVNAVNLVTGKEIWRFRTRNIVWASPTIVGDLVYVPCCDGILHILNARTGKKVSEHRTANNMSIFSSPVFADSAIIMATDEGAVLSLKGRSHTDREDKFVKKYVLWTDVVPAYFRNGMDVRIRDYFVDNGYQVIDTLGVIRIMTDPMQTREGTTIVVASPVIPDTLISAEGTSILRQYLDGGGKLIFLGINPLMFSPKQILNIEYGQPDTRAYKGLFPAFPTTIGAAYHLPAYWSAFASVNTNQVDTVLGMDENGLASAWIKYYGKDKKGGLIQVWLEQSRPIDYNFLKELNDMN